MSLQSAEEFVLNEMVARVSFQMVVCCVWMSLVIS